MKIRWMMAVVVVALACAPVVFAQAAAEPSIDQLRTAAGVAVLTALFVGVFLKKLIYTLMNRGYPICDDQGNILYAENPYYSTVLNLVTLLVASMFAYTGYAVLGLNYENILNAALVAIMGAASAIGGYEVARAR